MVGPGRQTGGTPGARRRSPRRASLPCALSCSAPRSPRGNIPRPRTRVRTGGAGDAASEREVERLDQRAEVADEKYNLARAALDAVNITARGARASTSTRAQSRARGRPRALRGGRLAAMYKSDGYSVLDVLFNIGDFGEAGHAARLLPLLSTRRNRGRRRTSRPTNCSVRTARRTVDAAGRGAGQERWAGRAAG